MTNKTMFRLLGLVTVLCAGCALAAAAETPAREADANGFVSLFNGKDLTGWDGDPRLWSVADGAIRGQTTRQNPTHGNTFLIYRGSQPKNFILKIKWRYQSGNSGVQYRSIQLPSKPNAQNKWVLKGYQLEVRELGGKAYGLYKVGGTYIERGRAGYLTAFSQFVVVNGENGKARRDVIGQVCPSDLLDKHKLYHKGDWNAYTLVCMGNYVEEYVNGQIASAYIDNRKDRRLQGLIGLQMHAGGPMIIDFKDIRLKTLPDHFGDAVLLFDGKDLDGWTYSSDAVKSAFSVADGAIVCTGHPKGYIRTKAKYANFVLRCQLRHHKPCNAGVLIRVHGQDKVWPDSIECQGLKDSLGDIWNIGQFPMKVDAARTQGRHTVKLHPSNEKPLDYWNNYEICINKGDLVLKVNGLVQNIATECKEIPGWIALQSEGGPVDYRNLVLIPIVDKK
jgi:3-keto-disaccharide hydrolase